MEQNLAPGFVTVEKAIELINSDTRKDPVVDVDFLLDNLPNMRTDLNYNIKLLKRDKDGKIVDNGCVFVTITTDWEKAQLEHAIVNHHKEATGKEIDPKSIGIRYLTTENDDSITGAAKIRVNEKPMTKVGDKLGGGSKDVSA